MKTVYGEGVGDGEEQVDLRNLGREHGEDVGSDHTGEKDPSGGVRGWGGYGDRSLIVGVSVNRSE